MNPTLSTRLRHHNQEAAYWRMHPPTSWRSTQALVEASPLDAPPLEAASTPVLLAGVPPEPAPPLAPQAQGRRADDQRAEGREGEASRVDAISWLPLLVWALLVLIDASRALIELGTALAEIWRNQQPRARRSWRARGGMAMGWPETLAGVT